MTRCPSCGQQVPELRFCVRCRASLKDDESSTGRFAAAPREHRLLPAIVSSLFPHLPEADMTHYRVAMGVGTLIVLALGIAGLFPVALAGAAVLVPLLAALYLHDVNVYEDEPLLVIGFTLAWGAVAGVAIALLGHALAPSGVEELASGHRSNPLVTIVLLPALELVLAVAGPALVLLPHRRYNDVLDGVTFGAAAAAALSATQVIVNGYRLFEHGLAPGGHVVPWIWRLLTLRVALPILAMAATGAACGALWLRVRGPAGERGVIGRLGDPVTAFTLRAGLLMAAAAGQRWLPVGMWFATLVILDAVALVWLRQMIQLGLREESTELEIGPSVECPNCGRQTPRHTFCGECGVSLRALPKRREPPTHRARVFTRHRLAAFAGFIGILVVATALIGALAPAHPRARCSPSQQCGSPPQLAAPLRTQSVWRSSAYGYQLQYSSSDWQLGQEGSAGLELRSLRAPVELVIKAGPGRSPAALLDAEVARLHNNVLGLAKDPQVADTILGPALGYRYGAGGAFVGAIDSPQGVQDQVLLNVVAASHANLGIVATVLTTENKDSLRRQIYGLADSVLNSVTWPGEAT